MAKKKSDPRMQTVLITFAALLGLQGLALVTMGRKRG